MIWLMSQLVFPNKNNLLSESTIQIMQGHRIAYQTQHEKATHKKRQKQSTDHGAMGELHRRETWSHFSPHRMTIPGLKQICEVLDIERSGTKRSIMERIMEFLLKPTSSGLKVPQKKKGKLLIIMCCMRVRHTEDIFGE